MNQEIFRRLEGTKALKEFLKKNKALILHICLLLLVFAALSGIALLILMAMDVVYFDDGVQFSRELFATFKNSWIGWLSFIGVQVLVTTLLSFVPGTSMTFILLSQTMFDYAWQAFLLSFISVMTSSFIMYFTGRFGGYKLSTKILGEEDCEKASRLLNGKAAVFFPIMMTFPAFPDDALIMIAGTLKMSLKWFLPSVIIGRGIGIATITFGLSFVPFEKFTSPWHWVAFILACIVFGLGIFFGAKKFSNWLEKRKQKQE